MKHILSLSILCLISVFAVSQKSTLTLKNQTFPATSFVFTSYVSYGDARLFPDRDINITVAKKNTAGLIQISVDLPSDKNLCDYFHKCGISGDIAMELASGDTIICKDLGINDFIDGLASATYELSTRDMDLLKKSNIEILRFYMQTFNTKGNYLAANFHHVRSNTPDEFTRKKELVSSTKTARLIKQIK